MDELHSKYAAAHNRSSIWSSVYYQTIMYTRELGFESEYIFVGLQSLDDIATYFHRTFVTWSCLIQKFSKESYVLICDFSFNLV